jgi:peroxiredoxin
MGRLEDIVARNQKALRRPRNLFELVPYILEDHFGAQLDPKIRRRNFIALAFVIGLAAAVVGGIVWVRERESGIVLDRHGERVAISDLWRGHRTLVVFFPNRTCDYCRRELLELNAHQVELAVSVIGVSSDKPAELERLRKDLDLSFELYSDAPLALAKHWKIEIRGLQGSRYACETVLLVEPSGEPSYENVCGYPELTAILAATSRLPIHNQ